ncbi:MAG: hypothetical protein ACFFCS_17755 [Candidatus Hodarchaeota archaeon]
MSNEKSNDGNGEVPREKPRRPKAKGKVFLKAEALKSIILYAKRYANETIPEYNWKEVYGFLIGQIKGQDVHVDTAVPMTSGEATEVSFGPEHYSKAWQLDTEISAKNDNSFVCGWWHTHPFKSNPQSLFLSSIDVYNHMGFQDPNPLSIALVHDPSKIKSKEIPFGVKVFRLSRTDLTHVEMDRLALDLLPEGNTKSDENEWIYYEVPFEVIDITPELFFESLVDVFEKTKGGKPIETAYLENEAAATKAAPGKLTSISDLGSDDQDFTGFMIKEELTKKSLRLDITSSLPDEMENTNKVHVIPLEEFYDNDKDLTVEEGDEHLENALTLKKTKAYSRALAFLRRSQKIYAPLKAKHKLAFIKNEMMECYYWNGEFDDSIIESDSLLRAGEELGQFYFMGNAQEFKARSYLKKGDDKKAMHSFQEARKHFENGRIFGKAGTCMEMIGRIQYSKTKPDFESVALFFTKALQFYQSALRSPINFDPEWARDGKMSQHAAILEKLTEEITMRLSNSDIVNKIQSDLSQLDAW